jgi:hypothetical protein
MWFPLAVLEANRIRALALEGCGAGESLRVGHAVGQSAFDVNLVWRQRAVARSSRETALPHMSSAESAMQRETFSASIGEARRA